MNLLERTQKPMEDKQEMVQNRSGLETWPFDSLDAPQEQLLPAKEKKLPRFKHVIEDAEEA